MDDNEVVVMFCHPKTAVQFVGEGKEDSMEIAYSMIISKIIPEDEIIVVPKKEFIEWLKGKKP